MPGGSPRFPIGTASTMVFKSQGVSFYYYLDPTCNKYCDLIGLIEVSILHRKSCKLCGKSCKAL